MATEKDEKAERLRELIFNKTKELRGLADYEGIRKALEEQDIDVHSIARPIENYAEALEDLILTDYKCPKCGLIDKDVFCYTCSDYDAAYIVKKKPVSLKPQSDDVRK